MGLLERLSAAGAAFMRPGGGDVMQPQAADITYHEIDNIGTSEELARVLRAGEVSGSGEAVSPERALGLSAVYAAVRLAADSVAQLPLNLMIKVGDQSEKDTANPLFGLLRDQPNEWQTSFEWRELMQRDLELRGNAYSLKVRGIGGRTQELLRLHPDQVTPKQDRDTLAITYEYQRPDGRRVDIARRDMFHVRGFGHDGVVGKSPIRQHRETIGSSLAMRQNGARFFANGARPLGAIESEHGFKTEEAQKAFREDFDSIYSGTGNASKTLLLPAGMSYRPISISPKDSQYIEGLEFSIAEVARMYIMPPHMLGDLRNATFSNIEHQGIEFVTYSLNPRFKRWEQAVKRDLLDGDPNREVKFNVAAFLRGDTKSQAESLQIARRNGIINANEWRELMDMNRREDPGGDEYIVEENMRVQDGTNPAQPATEGNDE